MPKVSKKESSKGTTDVKPKGRKTAYSIFVQTCRDEHRKKNPNSNVNFAEFSKACSERWNKMSDKEKGRFKTLADKVSYCDFFEFLWCLLIPTCLIATST